MQKPQFLHLSADKKSKFTCRNNLQGNICQLLLLLLGSKIINGLSQINRIINNNAFPQMRALLYKFLMYGMLLIAIVLGQIIKNQ